MKTKIGVFFGGRSTEHEISIISANQAINAFNPKNTKLFQFTSQKKANGTQAVNCSPCRTTATYPNS